MTSCVIKDCYTKLENHAESHIPMFSLPKTKDLQNKWFQNIDSNDACEKLKAGGQICLIHFENHYIKNKCIDYNNAVPTLKLNKGNTFIDYEELLAPKPPTKKKRGTSGLMNLQIARKKKLMRRERMQKLAEIRRIAKLENLSKEKPAAVKPTTSAPLRYEASKDDYFLGDHVETKNEKIVISLRLTSLVKHLHDSKTAFTKGSIRDAKLYPIFNRIRTVQELLSPENPVFWNEQQVKTFIEKVTNLKGIMKQIDLQEIDGESLLNLSKHDLKKYFNVEANIADILGNTCEQLKKETIMRFVNS
ncbi:hypothetical protein PVAND_008333 [Polypedilum vanderplanki]|uniref:THAP-type domain-containing protein n=1 Tax=Polypedilum vanderplanki TaxID=319348 RepID=A0A9J6C9F6_POLVA|nr:hypothetical protein PVAND_008333 [Polypedilum vanderplanki]